MKRLAAGIMPDYRKHLPRVLARNEGKWVWHEGVRPGVYKHIAENGEECLTVRVILPANGRLSSNTLRLFAELTESYAEGARRTSRNGFEFVGVRQDGLDTLVEKLERAGYPVGGTGTSLHQIKSCPGFLHCQNPAVDAPSLATTIGNRFFNDIVEQRLPSHLKVSVSGCSNQCGGGVEADIGITGVFLDPPQIDDQRLMELKCDVGLLCTWCPTGAIRPKPLDAGLSISINTDRCVRCGSCAIVCPGGVTLSKRRGVSLAIGGLAANTTRGPRLARIVVPFIPIERVLEYDEVLNTISAILDIWQAKAREGERLGDFVERIGWPAFFRVTGLPFDERIIDNFFSISVRRNLQMKGEGC